mmetsp:Transcript_24050/g.63402  ORF Transcript_24050/g.63402 Transcript_24050/m.63402 type:complete len:216 (-) Transcript_24050:45-692(-)
MMSFFRTQEPVSTAPSGDGSRAPTKMTAYSQAADRQLEALLAEEARLQTIRDHQRKQIEEVQHRAHQATEPDPQLADYMRSLEASVLQEDKAKEARLLAAEANGELMRARLTLKQHEDMARAGHAKFTHTSAQFSQIATDIAYLRTQVNRVEFALGQARDDYGQRSETHRKHIAETRENRRLLEGRRADLEVEVSRLQAEVRWYQMRCGEEMGPF